MNRIPRLRPVLDQERPALTTAASVALLLGLMLGVGALLVITLDFTPHEDNENEVALPPPRHVTPTQPEVQLGGTSGTATANQTDGLVAPQEVEDLRRLAELEEGQNFDVATPPGQGSSTGSQPPMGDRKGGAGDESEMAGAASAFAGDGSAEARSVEEADIVHVVGDRMYILNPWRGLLVVDLSNPHHPTLVGRAAIEGQPVDLYVADGMAYVTVQDTYGYWYGYVKQGLAMDEIAMAAPDYHIGSRIVIVDVSADGGPQVKATVNLEGQISQSRKVGDVIYFVSTQYGWYEQVRDSLPGGPDEVSPDAPEMAWDTTTVSSLLVRDPSKVKMIDQVLFVGNANQVHASDRALFVAQSSWDENPRTKVSYIDISDPAGTLVVRGTMDVKGMLWDKYQMDHFGDTFRMVTHDDSSGSGRSDLWIFDVRNPDVPLLDSRLTIDDAGSLMATRFAGDRLYTIHLPQNLVDPLDVIDLSDPTHPVLTDVLEIPGWVSHIEVRGDRLITLGIAEVSWPRQVAVSLFDVADPSDAVLLDRVSLEGASSSSAATWDPKALTVLDEQGLVLVPYSSWNSNYDTYEAGVQLVMVDLTAGDLTLGGTVEGQWEVSRTRALGDLVVATSPVALQVIDPADPHKPIIIGTLELAASIVQTLPVPGTKVALELVQRDYGMPAELRVVPADDLDLGTVLAHVSLPLQDATLYLIDGGVVAVGHGLSGTATGGRYEVFTLDENGMPKHHTSMNLPNGDMLPYGGGTSYNIGNPWQTLQVGDHLLVSLLYHYEPYYGEGDVGSGTSPPKGDEGKERTDDETGDDEIDETTPPVYQPEITKQRLAVLDTSNPDKPLLRVFDVDLASPSHMTSTAAGDAVIITDRQWGYDSEGVSTIRSSALIVTLATPAKPIVSDRIPILGTAVGDDLAHHVLYTTVSWGDVPAVTDPGQYQGEEDWSDVLVAIDISQDKPSVRWALSVDGRVSDVVIQDQQAILLTSPWLSYWGYGGCYDCVRVGYSTGEEGIASGDGSSTQPPAAIEVPRSTVVLLDLSGRSATGPTVLSRFAAPGVGNIAAVGGDLLVLRMDGQALITYDLSDPSAPVGLSMTALSTWPHSVVIDGNSVVVSSDWYGVQRIPLGA